MRQLLFAVCCSLLACAHSRTSSPADGAVTPPGPVVSLTPEEEGVVMRAWEAVEGGESAKALALVTALWDAGHAHPDIAWAAAVSAGLGGDAAASSHWLERAVQHGFKNLYSLRSSRAMEPVRALPGYDALLEGARRNARAAREAAGVGSGLERISPAEAGISEPELAALVKAAEEASSSGLVLLRRGKLVGEWYFGGESERIEAMSATKGVVALAIGLLIDDGKIPSVDTPVSHFFPEWKEGLKAQVTLRHLLSHTSGLAARRTAGEIYEAKDYVRLALDSAVVDEPGRRFFYNNKATNLVAGIAERAAGEKLEAYLRRRLFTPLGIQDIVWSTDPSGNPVGMAGFKVHPLDFAKLGQLLLQRGVWRGERILSEAWIRELGAAPAQSHDTTSGLLWWLVYEEGTRMALDPDLLVRARGNGASEASLGRVQELMGRDFEGRELYERLFTALGAEASFELFDKAAPAGVKRWGVGRVVGFAAMGQGGQQLLVFPEHDIVVARMAITGGEVDEAIEFRTLGQRVLDLVRPAPR
ncbi:beta-lactamase family protein [Myxococcus stipitatus]|uniref:serine hydrolase domain-containing protein n=1 Tax=Myxococcus stipitatus TaxID=83455 RepID=UPI001F1C3E84|nr:serine hydrolase [Myxococcus stipitatus]MCE9673212.1 beta-lactamase family protein [Myxococcus stipitatus]